MRWKIVHTSFLVCSGWLLGCFLMVAMGLCGLFLFYQSVCISAWSVDWQIQVGDMGRVAYLIVLSGDIANIFLLRTLSEVVSTSSSVVCSSSVYINCFFVPNRLEMAARLIPLDVMSVPFALPWARRIKPVVRALIRWWLLLRLLLRNKSSSFSVFDLSANINPYLIKKTVGFLPQLLSRS